MPLHIALLAGGACTAHDASLMMLDAMSRSIEADGAGRLVVDDIYYIERSGAIRYIAVNAKDDLSVAASAERLQRAAVLSVAEFVSEVTSRQRYVFSLLQGTDGEDGVFQGFFKVLGVLSNLGDVYPAALSRHKWSQSLVAEHLAVQLTPIRTARFGTASSDGQLRQIASDFAGVECIVKPNDLGGSVHTTVIHSLSAPALRAYLTDASGYAEEFLVQQRVQGAEYTVGCMRVNGETVVLPIAEVLTASAFLGFTEKWTDEGYAIRFLPKDNALAQTMADVSKILFDHLGFDTACRFDFIASSQGLYFLEANSKPGLASDSFFTCMLKEQGLSLADFALLSYEDARRKGSRKVHINYASEFEREARGRTVGGQGHVRSSEADPAVHA